MKYADVRPLLRAGDLCFFWHTDDWKGKLIHWWTGGPTHVAIVWTVAERVLIVEATLKHCVRVFPLSEAGPFTVYRMGANWTEAADNIAKGHLNDNYSQVLAVLGGVGIGVDTEKRWQCAKMARYIASACTYPGRGSAIPELFASRDTPGATEVWAATFSVGSPIEVIS